MKIFAYSHRNDETEYFKKFSKKYNIEINTTDEEPTLKNVSFAKGYECISVITTIINKDLLEEFKSIGVKYISTRTIGYDHIDINYAEELGISVGNVTYSPISVADYTIMLILMITRKAKLILERSSVQDYSLEKVQGVELSRLTIGVMGTGRIGRTVIKHLSGFGCRIIAYDIYENDEVKKYAEYVSLKELFKQSDLITLHMPATDENYHIINKKSLDIMKDNVFIVNTARGSLIDTEDLISYIEKGKVIGAGLDVIEHEPGLYYNDLKGQVISNRQMAILKSFPNVIVTPHTAFYTNQAVSDMVENSIKSCILFMEGKENPWQIK
ncbi:D-isomer specific 2-hydroxyacid dehydrogenase family protein [Clostridium sp. BJN0001]|uniref:D-isomer specific 2-hydroxyacid dehydrogenase family protein n=1 Tax=Clostridium sp. BJN0001 TaxID=2930219 RepID=UPI001FD37371|nr:D-isomer specific 2-hydroxyacid dehydrogenase family protein [Clostridium sp. BJN0001]